MYWEKVLDEVLNKKRVRHFTINHEAQKNSKRLLKPKQPKRQTSYVLGEKFSNIYFTKRESECMLELLKGKSMKGIAEVLGLSSRTVEFYVKNMKRKVGCRTKFELIDIVRESDFFKNLKT